MEPSTRELEIDLGGLVNQESAYITMFQEFGDFITVKTPEDLKDRHPYGFGEKEPEFFVSTSKELVSEEVKVLFPIEDTFYHFFIDSLPTLLKLHKQDPNILFVLYLQRARPNLGYEKFLVLLFRILDSINMKYRLVSTINGVEFAPVYEINNYILIPPGSSILELVTFVDVQYAVGLAFKYARDDTWDENELVPPFRKVYLTRGGKGSNIGPVAEDYIFYKDDLRMHEEEKLQEFFSSLGYEIVEPETKFDSIMEQIFYMREVKTLVSVTCSGLANMLFMQPGQLIIELQAELVQIDSTADPELTTPKQNLHNFYQPLSFMGGHTYIGIASKRNPEVVIEKLSKGAISYLL
jgi:hypothetical protein